MTKVLNFGAQIWEPSTTMPLMPWRVEITGGSADLASLALRFPAYEDPSIMQTGGSSFLLSERLTDQAGEVDLDSTSALLMHMNGACRLFDPEFTPAVLTQRFEEVDEDGTVIRTSAFGAVAMSGVGTLHLGGRVSGSGDLLDLGRERTAVGDVLRVLGKPGPLGWVECYKIQEIASDVAGGKASMIKSNWLSGAELDAFGQSANHQGVSGDEARHIRMPGDANPEKAITLEQGRALALRLAHRVITEAINDRHRERH